MRERAHDFAPCNERVPAIQVTATVDVFSPQSVRRVERVQTRDGHVMGTVHSHDAFPVLAVAAKLAQSCMMAARFSSMSPRRYAASVRVSIA